MENINIIQSVIQEMKENYERIAEIEKRTYDGHFGYNMTPEERKEIEHRKNYYKNLPKVLRNNKDIIIEAVKCDGRNCDFIDKAFYHDKDVAKASIVAECENEYYFRDMLDKNFVLELVEAGAEHGRLFCGPISGLYRKNPEAFNDDEFVKKLLKLPDSGETLVYASERIMSDKDTVMEGLKPEKDYLVCFRRIGDNLKIDPDIQFAYFKNLIAVGEAWCFPGEVRSAMESNDFSDYDKIFIAQILNRDDIFRYFEKDDIEPMLEVRDALNQEIMDKTNSNDGISR